MFPLCLGPNRREILYPFLVNFTSSDVNFTSSDVNHQFSSFAERHFQRLSRLLQASMFIDFMWQNMRLADASQQEDVTL